MQFNLPITVLPHTKDRSAQPAACTEGLVRFPAGAIQMISCRGRWPWTKPGYITVTGERATVSGVATWGRTVVISLWLETEQQSVEWRHGGSSRNAQKISSPKLRGKTSGFDFLGSKGILLIHYLPMCRTVNAQYYSSLLVQVKDILWGKIPKESHKIWFCTMPQLTGHL
jgi:hypothetical protein